MGKVDGALSDDEAYKLSKNPIFNKISKDLNIKDVEDKIESGEISLESSVQFIKSLEANDQIDALAVVWHILACDGFLNNEEKELMDYILKEVDTELITISNRLQELLV
tara:strand:- start:353 stop:679 length:327 start_codon:yes stop_codon:yes gene_type:complete